MDSAQSVFHKGGAENCLYSVNHVLNKCDWSGRKYRWDNQKRRKSGLMRTGECWEGGSPFLPSPAQITEEAGCDLPC